MTNNWDTLLENIDESFDRTSGDNLLQWEINAITQDQINNNGCRQERKKALIIGDSMVKGVKNGRLTKNWKLHMHPLFPWSKYQRYEALHKTANKKNP